METNTARWGTDNGLAGLIGTVLIVFAALAATVAIRVIG